MKKAAKASTDPSTPAPIVKWSEQWWSTRTPEIRARRCTAHRSDKSGRRCRNTALVFQTVCRYHGGASKNAKNTAQRRLGEALDRMARGLLSIAESAESESVRLAAIKEVLNLGGITSKTSVEVDASISLRPFEEILTGIAPLTREESRALRGLPDTPALAAPPYDEPQVIDAEIVAESAETPADRRTERRNRPERRSGRPKRSTRRSEPDDDPGPGYMSSEEAAVRAHQAALAVGAVPAEPRSRLRR
ncbi:hypothetical protein BH10ACT9_BH10ACT9_36540 [soil metagenome]